MYPHIELEDSKRSAPEYLPEIKAKNGRSMILPQLLPLRQSHAGSRSRPSVGIGQQGQFILGENLFLLPNPSQQQLVRPLLQERKPLGQLSFAVAAFIHHLVVELRIIDVYIRCSALLEEPHPKQIAVQYGIAHGVCAGAKRQLPRDAVQLVPIAGSVALVVDGQPLAVPIPGHMDRPVGRRPAPFITPSVHDGVQRFLELGQRHGTGDFKLDIAKKKTPFPHSSLNRSGRALLPMLNIDIRLAQSPDDSDFLLGQLRHLSSGDILQQLLPRARSRNGGGDGRMAQRVADRQLGHAPLRSRQPFQSAPQLAKLVQAVIRQALGRPAACSKRSARERTAGDDGDAPILQKGQNLFLGTAVDDAVRIHHAGHRGACGIFPDDVRPDRGNAVFPDDSLLLQLLERFDRLIDRVFDRPSMQLVQIDIIRAKPAQALLHSGQDIGFGRIPCPALLPGVTPVADLRGEDDAVSASFDRPADQLLIAPGIVQIRRVQQADAELQRLMDETDRPALLRA
ncbi:hypothetical protein BN871_AG_00060 [Paenibacillus sp. P22]|nr:hypothetical protein BN871_AG_00060 [Paenibacillus sp. P22]